MNLIKKAIDLILLEAGFIILSLSYVCAKLASGHTFLSPQFSSYLSLSVGALVVYAILWQQVLKRFSLTVAFSNRSMLYFWILLWSVVLFGERITLNNLLGISCIIAGIIIMARKA